jgi:hypothetical protein
MRRDSGQSNTRRVPVLGFGIWSIAHELALARDLPALQF